MTLFSERQKQDILLLIQQNRKIEAIKWVVDHSDLGLKEAKDYVENLAENPNHTTTQSLTNSSISPIHAQEIYTLIQQNQKIEAIKLVKKYSTLDLKDAKEFVESFSVHDKFHRTLILSGFCLLKIAKISLNSSFFPKPIKR